MFYKGDKVRLILPETNTDDSYCCYIDEVYIGTRPEAPRSGDTGVVTEFKEGVFGTPYVVVRLDVPATPTNGEDNGWRMLSDWLELVEEE